MESNQTMKDKGAGRKEDCSRPAHVSHGKVLCQSFSGRGSVSALSVVTRGNLLSESSHCSGSRDSTTFVCISYPASADKQHVYDILPPSAGYSDATLSLIAKLHLDCLTAGTVFPQMR